MTLPPHPAPRTILHFDLDAFFCAVEELLDPTLTGTMFAVGGRVNERGVLATASYAARKLGLHSAMPTAQALRLCPSLRLLPPRHGVYSDYSHRVMDLVLAETPLFEQISIDEAFLDFTGDGRAGGEIAAELQARIRSEIGLPCSFGVAANKLVAKIATNVGKPNGLVVVLPGEEAAFLAPLPMTMLWGVGPKTRERLAELGLRTIGDIAAHPEADLARRFGEAGRALALRARGQDDRPVETSRITKSISQETTFARDVRDGATLRQTVLEFSESVAASLRQEGLVARTVKIKVRWPPFETITRQATLAHPTDLEADIFQPAWELFQKVWREGKPVRLLGVGVSGLAPAARQLSLFGDPPQERAAKLAETVDKIRAKYGWEAVKRASMLKKE
jgi:DNA polymerase IV